MTRRKSNTRKRKRLRRKIERLERESERLDERIVELKANRRRHSRGAGPNRGMFVPDRDVDGSGSGDVDRDGRAHESARRGLPLDPDAAAAFADEED